MLFLLKISFHQVKFFFFNSMENKFIVKKQINLVEKKKFVDLINTFIHDFFTFGCTALSTTVLLVIF
jgi:hypothetical protein